MFLYLWQPDVYYFQFYVNLTVMLMILVREMFDDRRVVGLTLANIVIVN